MSETGSTHERRRAQSREGAGLSRSSPWVAALGRAAIRAAAWSGFPSTYRVGGVIGAALARCPGDLRRATRINLELCFPELAPAAREALAHASAVETGRTILELGALWCWAPERVLELVREVRGAELVDAARDAGRGVILLTPHLGAWEMAGLYTGSRWPLTALYKPPPIREMERFYTDSRQRTGSRLVPADAGGVRALQRALRAQEVIGILPDQDPGFGSGIFAPYFGVLANTTTLVAKLAAKSRAPVLLTWAERLPAGAGFRVNFVESQAPELQADDVAAGVRAMNRALERLISTAPQQYLWSYKRFRYRPKGWLNPYRHGLRADSNGPREAR